MRKISLLICSFFLCFILLSCDANTTKVTDPSLTDTITTDTTDVKVYVRCLGITQSGDRCKRMTSNACGYCWQHLEQAPKTYE